MILSDESPMFRFTIRDVLSPHFGLLILVEFWQATGL